MLLITAHINIKGLSLFHPNSAAGNVRGWHCYKGRFIREVSVCSLILILYQKSPFPVAPFATRLIKLRPPLMKPDRVTPHTDLWSVVCDRQTDASRHAFGVAHNKRYKNFCTAVFMLIATETAKQLNIPRV
jgi:hypothetical protein